MYAQKMQIELMLREAEQALEELDKLGKDAVIYKGVGQLLIKSKKGTVKEDLVDKKETLTLRLKTLEKQEERIQKRFQELQEQIKASLGKKEGAG